MPRRRKVELPIQASADGFVVRLDRAEQELVMRLLAELADLMAGPADLPALRRLFPPAYHLDEHAAAEEDYQRLMREELVASRLAGILVVRRALDADGGGTLDEAGLVAFMQALNGLRLVLGTMLDVDEGHDLADVAEDDPMLGEHHLYGYLSYLLDAAVNALQGGKRT